MANLISNLQTVKPSVLVTGATGHIGNNLTRFLVKNDFKTGVLVRSVENENILSELPVDLHVGDIFDNYLLSNIFQHYDVICHLAGYVSVMPGQNRRFHDVNHLGTCNVLNATIKTGKRLIYMSSSHAIPSLNTKLINEQVSLSLDGVRGAYGKSKYMATDAVLEAISKNLVDATVLHPTGVIGPYDIKLSNMGQIIKSYKTKGNLFYIDGTYDFVDVRDVSLATIQTILNNPPEDRYILSGHQVTVYELLGYLAEISGRRPPVIKVPKIIAKPSALLTGYCSYLVGHNTNFTSETISTLTSGAVFDSSLAGKHLNHRPRDWKVSIFDQYSWFDC